ncbi:hypothetical protein WN943_001945 [Citrus x changshan-huyou]
MLLPLSLWFKCVDVVASSRSQFASLFPLPSSSLSSLPRLRSWSSAAQGKVAHANGA